MKIFITRHGETDMNTRLEVSGVTEATLTENGINQAKKLAQKILAAKDKCNIKAIYVSPMKRARITASYTEEALGIKAIVDPRIVEFNFGDYEGANWNRTDYLEIKHNPFAKFPGGGESVLRAAQRAYNFLDDVIAKNRGNNILVVCHGSIGRIMDTYFNTRTIDEFNNRHIANCELCEYEIED